MSSGRKRTRVTNAPATRPWWNAFCCGTAMANDVAGDMEAMHLSDTDMGAKKAHVNANGGPNPTGSPVAPKQMGHAPVSDPRAAQPHRPSWSSSPLARRFIIHEGKIFFGPYEVSRTLGRGMQAKVKLARDTGTNEMVALKVVDVTEMGPRHMMHIRREVDALRRISHPNVLRMIEVVDDARLPRAEKAGDKTVLVMVLELAAGGELFDFLLYTGYFNEVIARSYFKQLLSALAACHGLGIYHRDIKPENIVLDGRFQLKLADFGLSAVSKPDGSDLCATYCGTRSYMAPEVLAEGSYGGAKADVWSAAVVLFIMLAGSPPMRLANSTDWWFKAILLGRHDKFWQAHEKVCPHIPSAAQPILNRMFVADPAARASVEELLEDPWLAGEALEPEQLFEVMRERKASVDGKKEAERQALLQKRNADLVTKRSRNQDYDAFSRNVVRSAGSALGGADVSGGNAAVSLPPQLPAGNGDKALACGPAAYTSVYLMGASPEQLLSQTVQACKDLGADAKAKPADWLIKAAFPRQDQGNRALLADAATLVAGEAAERAVCIAFRFYVVQQAIDSSASSSGLLLLTCVHAERLEGDIFAFRDAIQRLRTKLGDAVCAGGSESSEAGGFTPLKEPTGEEALLD